ncbi:MAG: PAS domain S-box protein [Syntrophobacteraceae bacterium]
MNMQSSPVRVLLIGDDENDYIVVRDLLSDLSSIEFNLKWVSDYGAATDAILPDEFDICLLGRRVEEQNGRELMQEALSRGAMTPIVFLTGPGDYDPDLDAVSKGTADWFTKREPSTTHVERSIRYAMERQRKRRELLKAKRVIRTLSECNHAMLHIKDEVELLRAICRILVDVGGYGTAWVGYAEEGIDKTVATVANYGYEKDYLETIKVAYKDIDSGSGPTGTCIGTGMPGIARAVGNQADLEPWKPKVSKGDYASSICLPLLHDGRKLGALTVYSSETDAFDSEEVEFLVKLSNDLSYGIWVLRRRRAQMQAAEFLKKAKLELERQVEERTAELAKVVAELRREIEVRKREEEALRESEAKYRLISENPGDVIWQYDLDTDQFVYVSPSIQRLFGFAPEEVVGQNVEAVLTPASGRLFRKRLPEVIAELNAGDESFLVVTDQMDQLCKDGSVVPVEVVTTLLKNAAGRIDRSIGVTRDVTEQRRVAAALRESELI